MAAPLPQVPFDNVGGIDFRRIDGAFALCQSAEARTNLARTECFQILTEGSQVDLKAYLLLKLIAKHCGDVATVLPPSDFRELHNLSSKARDNRITPLENILKAWGETVVTRLGLATESYNLLRYASKACKIEPVWEKACIKLNQIISVKGPWRSLSGSRSAPIRLQTLHYEYLSGWPGEGNFYWNDKTPIRLPFRQLSGHIFDYEGFVIISQPVAPLACPALTPGPPLISELLSRPDRIRYDSTLVSGATSARTLCNSGQRPTIKEPDSNGPALKRTQAESIPRDADERPSHRLRSSVGTAPHGKQARKQDAKGGRRDKIDRQPRLQARSRRLLRQARTRSAVRTLANVRKETKSWVKGNGPNLGMHYEKQEAPKRTTLDELLLADDCVTDILLDDICKTRKYTSSFQPTGSVQIPLLFGGASGEALAAISSLIIQVRNHHKLQSPALHLLCMQLTLYYDMLSSDCSFVLATTRQNSQHEEWCVVAKRTIEKGTQIKYLKGANATITSAIEGGYSSLGRIDGVGGKRFTTAGTVRFCDHNCEPNARLLVKDDFTVVIALQNIEQGEEITVYYADDFLGEGNQNCSCVTCKSLDQTNASNLRRLWPDQRGLASRTLPSPSMSPDECEGMSGRRFREGSRSENTTIQQADRISQRYTGLVDNFLNVPKDSSLWNTAHAWASAIEKVGGLDGPDAPTKLRADDVWKRRPSDQSLFAHLLHAFSLPETNVYACLQPNHPIDGSEFAMVIQQLFQPDQKGARYAVNIPLASDIVEVAFPESLQHQHPCLDGRKVTVNITPQYTFVDIHIGGAMGCCKLWARWPGSKYNRDLLQEYNHVDEKFLVLWDRLERPSFTITGPDDVINLEPGDLHATVTLKGGLTPGIEYFSAESVSMTYEIWKQERLDPTGFLSSCDVGLSFLDSRFPTAQTLCSAIREHQELFQADRLKSLILREEKEGKSCPACGEDWELHWIESECCRASGEQDESEYEDGV